MDKLQPTPLYVYHDFPPFVTSGVEAADSLSDHITLAFSEHSERKFITVPITRVELNKKIANGEAVLVLWANKKWFPGLKPIVSNPIIWDSDILVALKSNKIQSYNPSVIANKRFCSIKGHHYKHLEPWFSEGINNRVVVNTYNDCLSLLKSGKVDYFQIERSTLYHQYSSQDIDFIKIVEPSIDTFSRHILMFNDAGRLLSLINVSIVGLKNSTLWQESLKSMGDERFIKLFDMDLETLMNYEVEK